MDAEQLIRRSRNWQSPRLRTIPTYVLDENLDKDDAEYPREGRPRRELSRD